MIFVGPPGSGKRTRIYALLRHLYGKEVDEGFTTGELSHEGITVPIVQSKVHTEVDLSKEGSRDRLVIGKIITSDASITKSTRCVIVYNAHKLSIEAQSALRRMMENCVAYCKIILVCHDTAGIIMPIQGRCARIRIASPTEEDIQKVLAKAYAMQGLGELEEHPMRMFSKSCGRDLTRALWMLQASFAQTDEHMMPINEPWKDFVTEVAGFIMTEKFDQRPKPYGDKISIELLYDKFYELIKTVPADVILLKLRDALGTHEFFKNESERSDMFRKCSFVIAELDGSSVPIVHLVAFASHVISQVWTIHKAQINRERVIELRKIV